LPRYVAFLRAINVGGRIIRMERLREVFAFAGFSAVETFIASGNVIFDSRATNIAALERKVEEALEASFGFPIATFVRRVDDLGPIARHQPFTPDAAGALGTIHVGFLRGPLNAADRRRVLESRTDVDEFDVRGSEVYWLVRGKLTDSKLSNAAMGRAMGETTMRNRNTIIRLASKFGSWRADPSA
jgi:uncharacterized protein (DUF1697 family)